MRNLNGEMLGVIIAVQDLSKFIISDNILFKSVERKERNWIEECEKYYNSLPADLMKRAKLHKNVSDYRDVLSFKVTDEIRSTVYEELGKFPFFRDAREEYVDDPVPRPKV